MNGDVTCSYIIQLANMCRWLKILPVSRKTDGIAKKGKLESSRIAAQKRKPVHTYAQPSLPRQAGAKVIRCFQWWQVLTIPLRSILGKTPKKIREQYRVRGYVELINEYNA